jgi:hypothetical protein
MGADTDLLPCPVRVIVRLVEVDLAAQVLAEGTLDLAPFQVDTEVQGRDRVCHPGMILWKGG